MSEIATFVVWILIPALIGFMAVFFWHYFRDPYVKVEATIIQIRTHNYYAKAFGDNNEGDKEVIMNITLAPSKPVRVDNIVLKLAGTYFDAKEFSVIDGKYTPFSAKKIKDAQTYTVLFDIPKAFAVDTKAQVFAIANNIKRFCRPFPIKFGD